MSGPELSLARHALVVLGSATAVLVLTVVVLALLRPTAGWGLLVAVAGLAGCVAAMAAAARWSTRGLRRSGPAAGPD